MPAMKTAFLFPGQGSQSVGMLGDLASQAPEVADTFAEASGALGFDLWRLCQDGPAEDLNRTENTQPAMLAADVATFRLWRARGGAMPDAMAGHSLGEYAALVAAGSLGFTDAVRLVRRRGQLMQEAVPEGQGAMAAVIGLEDAVLEDCCAAVAGDEVVSCANYNAPGQVVIAGHRAAVDRACAAAQEAGARRALPLPVSVPSHCVLMQDAACVLEEEIRGLTLRGPTVPVLHNADVAGHDDPAALRAILGRQLWQPVRWTRTIETLVDDGVTRFAECGPGKVLAGLNRRISRTASLAVLDSLAAIDTLIAEWES